MGYKSPNEKLNIGAVGVGVRGPAILVGAAATENIVALCDVDDERSARGFAQYPTAKKYKDYRKMFETEGKNIDAVMIATPDHMHTPVALLAMQHGKHVYCEKPLTRTVWEAQLLADAAAKYKVATQMGNQGWNHEGTKTACEIFWSGEIGEVKELHAWTGGIYGGQPNLPATGPEATPVPPTLDWDLWLGCAEPRTFNPLMTNQWRAFIDFSTGGSLGDWLVHNLGPAHLALQLDKASPTSVECVYVEGKNQWLWPLRAHIVFEFPARGSMPPVTVHTYQNMRGDFQNPPGMAEGERLFPAMNNLAEKGRPFVQGGDGMMLVEHPIDGGWQAHRTTGPWWGGSSGRRPRTGWPGRRSRAGWSGWTRSSSWRFSRSQNARSRQRRRVCRIEGLHGDHLARRRRLAAAGVAVGGIQAAAANAAARHQSPAGLDSRLQGRRAGRVGIRRRDQIHRVARVGCNRGPCPRKADVGRE